MNCNFASRYFITHSEQIRKKYQLLDGKPFAREGSIIKLIVGYKQSKEKQTTRANPSWVRTPEG